MKPKGNQSKWASFQAADPTNNTPYAAVLSISEAMRAIGLNVTRVSIIQHASGGAMEAEEMGAHEFLSDPSFPREMPLQYFGDFQEPFYRQFNFGDTMELLRNTVPNHDEKNLPGAVLGWLRQMYANVYDVGNPVAGPSNTPSVPTVNPDAALLEANPPAAKAIIARVLPHLKAALAADGGL